MLNHTTKVSFTTYTTNTTTDSGDLGQYFTDPCKRNGFVEIWADSTLNLKIIHRDLRYNSCQHPCDLMVNL